MKFYLKFFPRLFLLGTLTTSFCLLGKTQSYQADYVVVGMGAAGAGVAKILSDDPDSTVIGVEAGANHDKDKPIKDATFAPILESNYLPQYFYQLNQVLQKLVPNADFNYTTGRVWGGGSSINGMQYVWGSRKVYKEWKELLGNTWKPKKNFRTLKKVEDYNGLTSNPDRRGFKGLVDIRQAPKTPTSMARKFVKAVAEGTGFPEILDYNDPSTPIGPFTRWQLFQKPNGRRESSSTAYLEPLVNNKNPKKDRTNLQILERATVLKILFKDKTAIGVRVLLDGQFADVFANKKVILCAGIYSNMILQLSGIGPKKELKSKGIKVLVDNSAVGQNLVNQLISVALFTANPKDSGLPSNDPNALYVGGAMLPDPTPPADPKRRGIQLIGTSTGPGNFIIAMIATQPKSRGKVVLQSNDPLQIPLVDDEALTNPADLETFINAYKIYILQIAKKLHEIDPKYNLVMPTAEMINDDTLLTEYILSTIDHTHHWTGTCKMAPLKQGGVVNRKGKVYGVENLVVADDSIAPFIPDGNTAACAFMIGRKIALQIKKENK